MKTILVPTDFTTCAEYASDFAAQLAERCGAELSFIHVLEIPNGLDNEYYINHAAIEQMSNEAESKLKSLSKKYASLKNIKTYLSASSSTDGIKNSITSIEADLIVMGTHGAHGFKDLVFGSNTEKIVRFAQCPVISIPIQTDLTLTKKALIAFDPEAFHENIIWELRGLQLLMDIDLHFVWIKPPGKKYKKEEIDYFLESHCQKADIGNYKLSVIDHTNIEAGINYAADNEKADLMVLSTHARKGLSRWLIGSVAEGLINNSNRPCLVLQLQDFQTHHLLNLVNEQNSI
ncbi:MAG: universal stress protein [Cyclobacteriaceae bacterium]|nr:universal stress protein [Cyclobacteriaceae bacterium]